ncbi:MAG: hypothetical protein GX557_09550 [Chloroflexi bacterium]|nr:hypothetical protein [Chloroflexota bacterium]
MVVTEAELTAYALESAGVAVSELTVWIEPEGVHVVAATGDGARHRAYALVGLAEAEQGARLELVHAELAGHRVPRWIAASLEKAANDALADMQLAWHVERVELGSGTATVTGSID